MQPPLIVEVSRSGSIESTHLVDVVVIDREGELIASAGDPDTPAAFRSSSKPIQAAVSLELGWEPSDDSHLAIACASHLAEPMHVGKVRRILSSVGLTEDALRCPEAWPVRHANATAYEHPLRVLHNCSGKHAGFLAASVAAGLDPQRYLDHEEQLQTKMLSAMTQAAGRHPLSVLVDGCGAATPVFPLSAIARAFSTIRDSRQAAAMLAHPLLVSGTATTDSLVLAAGVVTKGGAEGLSCATGTNSEGEAVTIASKVRDGSPRARGAHLIPLLERFGLLRSGQVSDPSSVTLGGGEPVGEVKLRNPVEL